jgi:hypothetical protein
MVWIIAVSYHTMVPPRVVWSLALTPWYGMEVPWSMPSFHGRGMTGAYQGVERRTDITEIADVTCTLTIRRYLICVPTRSLRIVRKIVRKIYIYKLSRKYRAGLYIFRTWGSMEYHVPRWRLHRGMVWILAASFHTMVWGFPWNTWSPILH